MRFGNCLKSFPRVSEIILLQGEVDGPGARLRALRSCQGCGSCPGLGCGCGRRCQTPSAASCGFWVPAAQSTQLAPGYLCQHQDTVADNPRCGKKKFKMLCIDAPLFFVISLFFPESCCELLCRLILSESAVLAPYYPCENGNYKKGQQL